MTPVFKRQFIAINVFAFSLAALVGATSGRSETTCIASWSDAAPIVQANALISVEALTREAPSKLDGSIVKATLCEENGRYIYSLVLREKGGKLKQTKVDAKRPY